MINIKYNRKKYYKNDAEISKEEIEKLLTKTQLRKLSKEKEINIRENKKDSQEKLYQKYKSDYKIDECDYRLLGHKIELWRKNHSKGFYNFVKYIDNKNEDTFKEAVLQDLKERGVK